MLRGRTIKLLGFFFCSPSPCIAKIWLLCILSYRSKPLLRHFLCLHLLPCLNDIYQFQVPGFHKWGDRISSCLLVQKKHHSPKKPPTCLFSLCVLTAHFILGPAAITVHHICRVPQSPWKVILKKCPHSHSGVELNISECPHILRMWSSKFQSVLRLRSQYEELKISKCPHILVYICGAHTQAVPKQKTPFVLFHSSLTSALASTGCYNCHSLGGVHGRINLYYSMYSSSSQVK